MSASSLKPEFSSIRVGVLGAGSIAMRKLIPALANAPGFELGAIASRNPEKRRTFGEQFRCEIEGSYESLLAREDLSAIYVCLPPALHEEWSVHALEAGKHVLCEKPLTVSAGSAMRMIDSARNANRFLMENYMFLHHPQHAKVKALIAEGAIGALRSFSSTFGFTLPKDDAFRRNPKLGGGAILDVGGYPLQGAGFFLGESARVVGTQVFRDKHGLDLRGAALLANGEGVTAQISFGFDQKYQCFYEVVGERGTIRVERAYTTPSDMPPDIRFDTEKGMERIQVAPSDHFVESLIAFREGIEDPDGREAHYRAILVQAKRVDSLRGIPEE